MAERNAGPMLLPCPFCGKVPTVDSPDGLLTAWAIGCDVFECPPGPCVYAETIDAAAEAWNKRAGGGVPAGDASDPEETTDG